VRFPLTRSDPSAADERATAVTVRDATLEVLRRHGLTRIFGNPGSTEVAFLTDLPDDFEFVLGLHEGAVVGMACGYALARRQPALVSLHTAPGLGNAVNAIANARDFHAPLVVLVGQQDRRHSAFAPFLTGRHLERLAGEYPVWTSVPACAQAVPGTIARARHEAQTAGGPALVVVPMGDWLEPAGAGAAEAPARVLSGRAPPSAGIDELAAIVAQARAPAIVVGAGADGRDGWDGVVALAQRLQCPVWQESFSGRVGFPQDHDLFAGHLPWQRAGQREALAAHDLVVVVGTGPAKLYLYDPGPLLGPDTRLVVVSAQPEEVHRTPAVLALLADPGPACAALAARLPEPAPQTRARGRLRPDPPVPTAPAPGEPLAPVHVLAALAERLPHDAVIVEETPSSQPELYARLTVRSPDGFFSCPNGGLGFGLAGSIGLRMGGPDRPVVAVLGDGSTLYAVQALWSAAHYGVGVLFVVMANGRYAVMDVLARREGGRGPWPAFDQVDIGGLARAFGCATRRVGTHDELLASLDEALADLRDRRTPLLLEMVVGAP